MKETKKILMALVACVMISTSYAGYVLKIETDVPGSEQLWKGKVPDYITVTLYSDEGRTTKLGEEVFYKKSPYTSERYRAECITNFDHSACGGQCCCPVRFTFSLKTCTDKLTPSISTRPWYTIAFCDQSYVSSPTQIDQDAWESFCAKIGSTPAGTIIPWATSVVPEGFLPANGATVEISKYPRLFAAIGKTYGGDGTSTFVLPDLRGVFIRGLDNGRGIDVGRTFGSYTQTPSKIGKEKNFEEK